MPSWLSRPSPGEYATPLSTVRAPGCRLAAIRSSGSSPELPAGLSPSRVLLLGEHRAWVRLGRTAERAKVSGASAELPELRAHAASEVAGPS